MKIQEKLSTSRTIYFDYLRVFATFAVIIVHVAAQNWHTTDVNGFDWKVFNFYDSIVRWCVPIFVMISGALFLNRNISIETLYKKYILRMIVSYIAWSTIYALFMQGGMMDRLEVLAKGYYHMWFIPMIIGIYMCVPLVALITKNDNCSRYFLVLALFFAFFIPTLQMLVVDFGNELIQMGFDVITYFVGNMNIYMVLGYIGYFVLGYYINKITLSRIQRIIIYILGILGCVATIGLDLIVALKTQTHCDHYYGYLTVNVFLEALAVFTWFKYSTYKNDKLNTLIQKMSKYSFGAYLVHVLVIEQLDVRIGLNTLSFNSVFSVICIGIITFVISFLISALLHRIPIVKKYMV